MRLVLSNQQLFKVIYIVTLGNTQLEQVNKKLEEKRETLSNKLNLLKTDYLMIVSTNVASFNYLIIH